MGDLNAVDFAQAIHANALLLGGVVRPEEFIGINEPPPDVDHELVYERVEGVVHRLLLCTPATRWVSRASFGIFGEAAGVNTRLPGFFFCKRADYLVFLKSSPDHLGRPKRGPDYLVCHKMCTRLPGPPKAGGQITWATFGHKVTQITW